MFERDQISAAASPRILKAALRHGAHQGRVVPHPAPEMAPETLPESAEVAAPLSLSSRARTAVCWLYDAVCAQWFILGMGVFIGIAAAAPEARERCFLGLTPSHQRASQVAKTGGYLRAEYSIKYGAVCLIFLCSGAGLKTKVLLSAASAWRLHLFTQVLSLVVTPVLGYALAQALYRTPINRTLVDGLVVCFCTSTTASTNVVFTKLAHGNEALALVNAVLGNLIGIFLTPAWLTVYLDATGSVPYATVIRLLVITVVAPLVVGNVLQYVFPARVASLQKRVNFGKVGSCMILLLVWSTFSNTFSKGLKVDAGSVVAMAFILLALYLAFTFAALLLPISPILRTLLRADDADAVAISMCAGTKTVALGIPIINAVYEGHPGAGLLALPLLMYHAEQILVGSILAGRLGEWVLKRKRAREEGAASDAATLRAENGAGNGAGAAGDEGVVKEGVNATGEGQAGGAQSAVVGGGATKTDLELGATYGERPSHARAADSAPGQQRPLS